MGSRSGARGDSPGARVGVGEAGLTGGAASGARGALVAFRVGSGGGGSGRTEPPVRVAATAGSEWLRGRPDCERSSGAADETPDSLSMRRCGAGTCEARLRGCELLALEWLSGRCEAGGRL